MSHTTSLARTTLLLGALLGLSVLAFPSLSFAAHDEKTDGFVCPVFNDGTAVGGKNPNAVPIADGDYTVVGPEVSVPLGATNGDGDGSPGGDHSSPGDSDYTAIWSG